MSRPNILWIVTTQWRAQACGYAGDANARTPHLDALAAEAVNYVEAVTPHPFGPFARAALLTGQLSPENGVRDYFDPLPDGATTVAHRLNALGYTTAFFGKWHLAPRDRHVPLVGEAHARMIVPRSARGGFAHWEGFEGGFLLNDPWLHGTVLPEPVQVRGYQSDVVCERAAAWFGGGPWFCVVSLEPPHPPYDAPSAGIQSRRSDAVELRPNVPRGGAVEERARRELAGYYAHIAATDRAIGRLLAAVDARTTIVVFTSVHGDMHGSHGLFRKGWPHEESVRVPLLVRGPSAAAEGANVGKNSDLVSLHDLAGSAVGWARGEGPGIVGARDGQQILMPSVVRLPHQCDRVWSGVRTRTRKLILDGDGLPWLCFDLERDPFERENLAGDVARASEFAALTDQARAAQRGSG